MAYSRGVQLEDNISGKIIDCAMNIARENGVAAVTVSEILRKMEITNRVFYNRFKNIDEVIAELYKRVVDEMRICIDTEYDGRENYYEYLIGLAVSVLEKTYETKLHFAGITTIVPQKTESGGLRILRRCLSTEWIPAF